MFANLQFNKLITYIFNNYFLVIGLIIFYLFKKDNSLILYISDNRELIDPLVYLAISPELFLIGLIIYFLLFISFFNKYNQNISFIKSMIMFLIIFLLIELKLLFILYSYDLQFTYLNDQFLINNFVLFIKILLIFVTIFFFISMYDNIDNENYLNIELPLIILISLVGMFLLVSSNDLFIMYLALELQSLALYIICAIKRYSNLSIEAGLKYFILGSFSSAILLLGISLIYGLLGTTNYYELAICLYPEFLYTNIKIIYFSIGCIFIGLLFKLGIVPFHL
jgi:NADH-quinone oxidoreductase subunit N